MIRATWIIRAAFLCITAICTPLNAKELKILFSPTMAPYVVQDGEHPDGGGFELEIFKEALAVKGYVVKPIFVPLGSIPLHIKRHDIDGGQRGGTELREGDGFFYASEPTVAYQDVAISLQKNHLNINNLEDLKGKSITSFVNAKNFLGPEFAAAVAGNPRYYESSAEKRKIAQLFTNELQVYVGDINIFKFHRGLVRGLDSTQEITIHKIFPSAPLLANNAVFRDPQVRSDFNAGIKQLKTSGEYKKIIERYIKD